MTFVLLLLGLVVGALAGAAAARARAATALAAAVAREAAAREELATARTALDYERSTAADKVALLEQALARTRADLKEDVRATSAEAADRATRQLLDLAKQTLAAQTTRADGDLARRQQAVEALVAPVQEALGKVEGRLREIEVAREGAYQGLLAQLGEARRSTMALQKETQSLVTALRKPQVRGSWGEMHLRRAVELAGLTSHCDFAEQVTADGVDGRVRPDLVVRLAGGRSVVVDAKVPLVAFLDAVEETDEAAREAHLRTHARHLRTHVESLAAKAYWEAFEQAPEFVVLFVPQDAVLDAALTHDKDLYEHALARRVLLTTPTSLVGMLLTVAHTWKQEALAQNAREVCDLGRELYRRLSALGGNVEKLGNALNRAVGAYNDTVGSLERSVFPQARRFRDLRVTDADLGEVEAIGDDTRQLTSPELLESAAKERPVAVVPPGATAEVLVDDEMLRTARLR